jgi:hypothetical protein
LSHEHKLHTIVVLYPPLFNSSSKFHRKLDHILSRLNHYQLISADDSQGLIAAYAKQHDQDSPIVTTQWQQYAITHAIIFDDGEEFWNEQQWLKKQQVPLREIRIAVTRVINLRTEPHHGAQGNSDTYEYIGRHAKGWGNPNSSYDEDPENDGIIGRDEAINRYQYDFEHDLLPHRKKSDVHSLAGKRLGCFCKPRRCHGDILADYLNRWDDGH